MGIFRSLCKPNNSSQQKPVINHPLSKKKLLYDVYKLRFSEKEYNPDYAKYINEFDYKYDSIVRNHIMFDRSAKHVIYSCKCSYCSNQAEILYPPEADGNTIIYSNIEECIAVAAKIQNLGYTSEIKFSCFDCIKNNPASRSQVMYVFKTPEENFATVSHISSPAPLNMLYYFLEGAHTVQEIYEKDPSAYYNLDGEYIFKTIASMIAPELVIPKYPLYLKNERKDINKYIESTR